MFEFSNKILLLLRANIKVRYRQTWIGFFWVLLNPILVFTVQLVLFQQIFQNQDSQYPFYLMSGLLPWFFLSQTVEMSCTQLKSHALLARNLRIGPFHLVTSLVLENYLNFLCYFILIALSVSFFAETPALLFAGALLASIPFFFFVACVSFCAAVLHTLFKDVKYIAHFLFTLLYFATPTFYKLDFLSESFRSLVYFNPIFWQLRLFRVFAETPEQLPIIIGINAAILVVVGLFSFVVWQKLHARVYLKL